MALEKCPECGNEVSSTAATCPKCGFDLKKNRKKAKEISTAKGCGIGCLSIIVIFFLIGVFSSNSDDSPSSTASKPQSTTPTVNTDEISVTFEQQDVIGGKQKIVVWTENKSKTIFTGNLSVTLKKKVDNRPVGSDMIFVEDLLPSQRTYAIVWVKPGGTLNLEYSWSSVKAKSLPGSGKTETSNHAYKMLLEKTEKGGVVVPKIEFFLATDRNFNDM
jgi:predicted nucleic acid-binding Zn ribbon protein